MTAFARRWPQTTFLGLALIVNFAAVFAARHVPNPRVAVGAVLDMTITVPAIYYWLVVRPGRAPKVTLIFIALLGLLRASFAFPALVPGRAYIAGAIELSVIAALAAGFRPGGGERERHGICGA